MDRSILEMRFLTARFRASETSLNKVSRRQNPAFEPKCCYGELYASINLLAAPVSEAARR